MYWIKFEKQEPPENEDVLITDSYEGYAVASWQNRRWIVNDDLLECCNLDGGGCIEYDYGQKITHWAQIRAPIKAEDK